MTELQREPPRSDTTLGWLLYSYGRLKLKTKEAIWGYIFILPWIVGLLIFTAEPMVSVLYNSFTQYNLLTPPRWVGLDNFETIFTEDPLFWKSLNNTLFYVGFSVPLQLGLGFLAALLVNRELRGMRIYRVVYYLPSMTPFVAMASVWLWTLSRAGLLNYGLETLGVEPQIWLIRQSSVKPVIVLLSLWYIGLPMVIFLAGLQSIPLSLYESAAIDGAGPWAKLRFITIPLMTPSILFNTILGVINSFQVFAHGFVLTGGGPRNASLFYVHYIYRRAFESLDMGYASALTLILFIIILIMTGFLFWTSRFWVHYERI